MGLSPEDSLAIQSSATTNLAETVDTIASTAHFEHPQHRELSHAGQTVLAQVLELIRVESPNLSEHLQHNLAEMLSQVPADIYNQLGLLLEAPTFCANPDQKGHWHYEIAMIRAILEKNQAIAQLFAATDALISDLVFMTMISDVGKAGPTVAQADHPSGVVRRIYTQAIFFEDHRQYLLAAYDPNSPNSLKPGYFPPELELIVSQISREPKPDGGPSDFDEAFQSGLFYALPLEVYLHVVKQVALKKAQELEDPALAVQAKEYFTLSPAEKEFLQSTGWDPRTARTRRFFTQSHVDYAYALFIKIMPAELIPEALCSQYHHLSQLVVPDQKFVDAVLQNPTVLKVCAFMEILDKTDAFYQRQKHSFSEETIDIAAKRQKALENAIQYTRNETRNQLKTNFPTHPDLVDYYQELITHMEQLGIFQALIQSGDDKP